MGSDSWRIFALPTRPILLSGKKVRQTTKVMNTNRLFTICLSLLFSLSLSAQPGNMGGLQFKVQLMADQVTWGVYVKPNDTISPSNNTNTGSGQVTLVTPVDFNYSNFQSHAGTWIQNARVNAPAEATDKAYVSFGFVMDEPKIQLYPQQETLLFTFENTAGNQVALQLIDNENDPFLPPNSYNSNPGNDLGIIDFSTSDGLVYYTYTSNYSSNSSQNSPTEVLASSREEE
jgi:hypothetical protein